MQSCKCFFGAGEFHVCIMRRLKGKKYGAFLLNYVSRVERWTDLEKPQITQMRLRRSTRRCRSHTRDLLRKPCGLAQGSSKLSPFAAALALLFDLENYFGSSKATATSCAPKAHLRNQRFSLMGLNPRLCTVILFRRKFICGGILS